MHPRGVCDNGALQGTQAQDKAFEVRRTLQIRQVLSAVLGIANAICKHGPPSLSLRVWLFLFRLLEPGMAQLNPEPLDLGTIRTPTVNDVKHFCCVLLFVAARL